MLQADFPDTASLESTPSLEGADCQSIWSLGSWGMDGPERVCKEW